MTSIDEAVKKIRSGRINLDDIIRIKNDRGMSPLKKRKKIIDFIPESESWTDDEIFRIFFRELRAIELECARDAAYVT